MMRVNVLPCTEQITYEESFMSVVVYAESMPDGILNEGNNEKQNIIAKALH